MNTHINMTKIRIVGFLFACLTLVSSTVFASIPGNDKREFTENFICPDIDGDDYTNEGGRNRFFPLIVNEIEGKLYTNESCEDCEDLEEVIIVVTAHTMLVSGVLTRVVEEWEYEGEGEDKLLIEVSSNFFAECLATGDVFYFGEDVEIFHYDDEGELVDITFDGAWSADDEDASPGIIMPGSFMLGARYFQEIHPEAMDRGENVEMGLDFELGEVTLKDCVMIKDTNALEDPKGKEFDEKIYCPEVGLVMDEELQLQPDLVARPTEKPEL